MPISEQYWPEGTVPLVCTRTLAYNHEFYIRECLEGILMQKTTFPVQVLVHEDCSTDNTAAILKEYQEKYPKLIKVFYQPDNVYSLKDPAEKRRRRAEFYSWQVGKYIALCEGDDYWTDPLKLQKQVEHLEKHPEYIFSCHRFRIYDEDRKRYLSEYASNFYFKNDNLVINNELFSKTWITQPLTAVIRTQYFHKANQDIVRNDYKFSRDVHIFYTLLSYGDGISLNEFMGVYRWHRNGVASKISIDKKFENGYNIYKELYQKNVSDEFLRRKFLYNLMEYLKYAKIKPYAKRKKILKEGLKLSSSKKEKTKLLFSFLIPSLLYRKISKIYLYFKWKYKEL